MLKKLLLILSAVLCFLMISCGENSTKITQNGDETDDPTDDSVSENPNNDGTDTEPAEENPDGGENQEDPNENPENPDENNEEPVKETTTTVEPSSNFETKTEALIVTTSDLKKAFQKFADFHTVTGIITKVVTVEDICRNAVCNDNDPLNDTQKAIKDYVMSVEGLRYLVLGGDIEDVPSRMVHDEFSILVESYKDDFYSDLYYADFSEWDSNGNGIYAEDDGTLSIGNDTPVLIANVAVGRISVSTEDEAELYFTKIVKHHTAFDTQKTKKSLLIANIATSLQGIDVNAGYYFESEGKTASIIPQDYSIKRLYTESSLAPSSLALPLDNASEKAAIEEGMNLIVHSGHGAPWLLTCEQGTDPDRDFDRNMTYDLKNTTLPFFLSCACEAGQFGYKNGDSAGENLMNAPEGGAIVYLGNTTTGLGIAGGSQFIDEMMKNMFAFPYSVIGESYLYAHATMPQNDTFNPPIPLINSVPVVTPESWQWTKKSIVMLGDPMTVFWRDPVEPFAAEIEPEVEENEGIKTVSFHFTPDLEGAALRIFAGEKLYDIPSLMYETVKINLDSAVETITVGMKKENSQYFFKEFEI